MARLVVFGDHRGTIWLDPRGWLDPGGARRRGRAAIVEKVVSLRPDLVLDTGDLVAAGDPPHWRRCDAELAPIRAAGIPIDAVPGNHETYGWVPRSARPTRRMGEFLRRFPRVGGNRWGSRDLGSARILLLDSNARVLTRAERVEQESWLSSALAAADADPNIGLVLAAWHHPPFTNTHKYGDDRFSADSFLGRLRRSRKWGAVFCGHVHGYERFRAESVSFVVSGGGGAAAHPFPRDHARWRHTPAFDATALPHLHFVEIEIEGALARAVSHHLNLPAGPDAPPRWIEGDRFEIRPRQQ
jgi:3',5'-cyclic AMP phosphodiesterase CpdA